MKKAAGSDTSVQSDDRNDGYRSIVSDLVSLIEQVQASMKQIELAIGRESPLGDQETAANVVVLDDVTPRYLKANAALDACNAGLGVALHFLLDTKTSKHGPHQSAESDRRPVRLIGRT
jgi:multidrug resistance efflux pump